MSRRSIESAQTQRGCILQPKVAVAATLGTGMTLNLPTATRLRLGGWFLPSSILRAGTTLSGLEGSLSPSSQGSRDGNLGLEDATALRLWQQMTATCFQLADCIRSQCAKFVGNSLSLWECTGRGPG